MNRGIFLIRIGLRLVYGIDFVGDGWGEWRVDVVNVICWVFYGYLRELDLICLSIIGDVGFVWYRDFELNIEECIR